MHTFVFSCFIFAAIYENQMISNSNSWYHSWCYIAHLPFSGIPTLIILDENLDVLTYKGTRATGAMSRLEGQVGSLCRRRHWTELAQNRDDSGIQKSISQASEMSILRCTFYESCSYRADCRFAPSPWRPANESCRYKVTPSLTGWAQP